MFGFSLTKLIFTIIAVAIVWQGFKWLGRMNDRPQGSQGSQGRQGGNDANKKTKKASAKANVEEMVKCEICGTFVAPGAKSCGKDDCPFSG